ncbi:MAG TPA: LuxR C-terminal-related transcriptional regulator [Burkholderiales bacterium]
MANRKSTQGQSAEASIRMSGVDESKALDGLTATEREIVKAVAAGRRNAEVAAALGLSPRTVETYRGRIMRKLRIDNLPTLVKFAIRQGLTTLD